MEGSTPPAPAKQTTPTETDAPEESSLPSAILFTSFGIGKSYIFHVNKVVRHRKKDEPQREAEDKPDPVLECWKEVFDGRRGWDFEKLKSYNKPLGETATLTFNAENCKKASPILKELREACEEEISATPGKIEAVFFTTGVAVLTVRVKPKAPDNILAYTLKDDDKLKRVHKAIEEVIELCKDHYITRMNAAEKRKTESPELKPEWFLSRFEEVDREGWEPKLELSYPLFFVDSLLYEARIQEILKNVAGSRWRQRRQSDEARVSYKGAEVYVDWSEALVSNAGDNRELIEKNFIIALASWYALVLMNKNSSMFLFEAYLGTVTKEYRSNANAVNQRNMAYKDVSDSALPIRWTTRRRDLFLLETIHRNWSSERWRENIEERMKLLSLHYESLEDERNERAGRYIAFVAISLAVFTLVSAIADLKALREKGQLYFWLGLAIPLLIGALLIIFFRLKLGPRSRSSGNKQPKANQSDEAAI
jgi:hypothetical protein